MGRGPKKHLKRTAAPSSWMLDKLSGTWAPKPSPGPHKLRDSIPLIILLRNRLKYALNNSETKMILARRYVEIDKKVRTDITYPTGFMDTISIPKTNQYFRLLYDVKGRFYLHKISSNESKFKLCKIKATRVGPKGIPYVVTTDGRTIRYPHPDIKINDVVVFDLCENKVTKIMKFTHNSVAYVTGGRNRGRIGTILRHEKHRGGFDIVHLKDFEGNIFLTRLSNVFIIGSDAKDIPVSLPRDKGVRKDCLEAASVTVEA